MKYLITYHTKLDNGYIDERQIILKNKYNAKNVYNKIASEKKTINIELEDLWLLFINYTILKMTLM